jgi:serine/threonine-protein phosphatase 2A regulatory subunit B
MHKAVLQKSFPDLHLNPIRQISPSFNEQYLLSADESQMFLWDMERPEKPYNVCDHACLKEDEGEEITCCEMHPKHDSIFLYGMSKGSLKVGDLRLSANVENSAVTFKAGVGKQRNILFDLISSVSSATFSGNSKYIVSRDYLTVKVWDICNSKKPLSTIILQEGLKSKLSEMLESESIYDQFQVSLSSDSSSILTGSYNNCFHLLDLEGNNCQYELTYKKSTLCRSIDKNSPPVTKMDLSKKVLASDFHPAKNMVAVAAQNCFFTYSL